MTILLLNLNSDDGDTLNIVSLPQSDTLLLTLRSDQSIRQNIVKAVDFATALEAASSGHPRNEDPIRITSDNRGDPYRDGFEITIDDPGDPHNGPSIFIEEPDFDELLSDVKKAFDRSLEDSPNEP